MTVVIVGHLYKIQIIQSIGDFLSVGLRRELLPPLYLKMTRLTLTREDLSSPEMIP